jgi:ribosomal-protein-alanine N-acetyltransferase
MGAATAILETQRLQLREVALSDALFFLRLLNDPSWLENIGDRGVRSEADAERYIRDNIHAPHQALGFGLYAVQLGSSTQPIGICGLVKRDFLSAPDLGVALLPEFVGQGYASEAARAVMLHAQRQLGIERLYAIVQRGNHRSVRLLERLGFRREEPRSNPQGTEIELYVTQLRA